MRHTLLTTLAVFVLNLGSSQLIYQYEFDGCGLSESTGALPDGVVMGSPECVCGPRNDALQFNGASDFLEMPVPGDLLTRDEYSFSFYLRPSGGGTILQQVFTNERICNLRDSAFNVQYFPTINTVSIRLADFGATIGFVEAGLDADKCWHQVTLVKNGRILELFVNGVEKDQFAGNQPINIFSDEPFLLAGTKCGSGQNIEGYRGAIDEITWYDRALTSAQVMALYEPIDEIITGDTLIFQGDSFSPQVSSSCADNILWQPSNGLSNSNVIQPVIGPSVSTTYNIEFFYTGCTATDSLQVVVVDEDDIDCERVLIPTAFTPNGDNLNDIFAISNAFIIDELLQFDILDRQGNTLFRANNKESGWDGRYRGDLMSSGIYIYKLAYECKGDSYSRTGSFNIIR